MVTVESSLKNFDIAEIRKTMKPPITFMPVRRIFDSQSMGNTVSASKATVMMARSPAIVLLFCFLRRDIGLDDLCIE